MSDQKLLGDANGDGHISVSDATTVQQHIAQLIELDKSAQRLADVNGSGSGRDRACHPL